MALPNSREEKVNQRNADQLALERAKQTVEALKGKKVVTVLYRKGVLIRTTDPNKWKNK